MGVDLMRTISNLTNEIGMMLRGNIDEYVEELESYCLKNRIGFEKKDATRIIKRVKQGLKIRKVPPYIEEHHQETCVRLLNKIAEEMSDRKESFRKAAALRRNNK